MTDAELVRYRFKYVKATGIFTHLNPAPNSHMKSGDLAGGINADGYVHIRFKTRITKAHQLAVLYVTGRWPDKVDHRNGIRHDNRWKNIRQASYPRNAQNRCRQKNNTSGFTGVTRIGGGRYVAGIAIARIVHKRGPFNTFEEAVQARKELKKLHHPFNPSHREEAARYISTYRPKRAL